MKAKVTLVGSVLDLRKENMPPEKEDCHPKKENSFRIPPPPREQRLSQEINEIPPHHIAPVS